MPIYGLVLYLKAFPYRQDEQIEEITQPQSSNAQIKNTLSKRYCQGFIAVSRNFFCESAVALHMQKLSGCNKRSAKNP